MEKQLFRNLISDFKKKKVKEKEQRGENSQTISVVFFFSFWAFFYTFFKGLLYPAKADPLYFLTKSTYFLIQLRCMKIFQINPLNEMRGLN
eukprot:TRINITY_DN20901_c0_g2_i1.p1 TRINITY_DN20901_c0_g2~~TRINITY_DN20901_c0_g2_i1.p1  ORF type:complete len:107 (-),score=1.93 TRINITY_DN20901_c0_g2_i1:140-412(-)